jgi:hypothetical protein
MLHHISVSVSNPLHVAEVLAEVMGGRSAPFPPHPGSYIVMAGDEHGTAIELYPATTQLLPGEMEAVFLETSVSPHYISVHAAISVPTTQEHIEQIGKREGWLVRLCDRGPFQVIEFWVENRLMLEMLPPTLAAIYLEFAKPENWDAFVEMADAMGLAERHRAPQIPVGV